MPRGEERRVGEQRRERHGRRLTDYYATIPDAAIYLNVSTKTIRKWVDCRVLSAFHLPSGARRRNGVPGKPIVRLRWADIEQFAEQHRLTRDASVDPASADAAAATQKPPSDESLATRLPPAFSSAFSSSPSRESATAFARARVRRLPKLPK
jgi:hypothetical protein